MKLTPSLALLALTTPAFAQTAAPAKPPVHHTTAVTHRAAPGACADLPVLSTDIPKAPGCPKTLYALRYLDTVVGTGPLALPMKLYTVNYSGYLLNGKKFDSSVDRKDPIVFPAGFHRVITGWDTGFQGMHVGGKRRLFIPYELAYGEAGKPPTIPEKSMLVFDVELIAQADLPQQPQTPPAPRQTPPTNGAQPTAPAKPATPPPPAPGAIPAPAPSSAPKPVDPTKPATMPPPTDPTKPAAVPPSTSPTTNL